MKFFRKKNNKKYRQFDVDTIFMDSHTRPVFDHTHMEGRIEQTIKKNTIYSIFSIVCIFIIILIIKSGHLQIVKGEELGKRSLRNSFDSLPLFARRGVIEDRNGELLGWNFLQEAKVTEDTLLETIPERRYTDRLGFGHVLGYVSSPKKDAKGVYWQTSFIGKDGVEKFYDTSLAGTNGQRLAEVDVHSQIQSTNIVDLPIPGEKLTLTVDARIQEELYNGIAKLASNMGYRGGSGVIMDVHSGDIIAMTSFPEYKSNVLTQGVEQNIIKNYLADSRSVFLNRAFQGAYAPGSIVKPFVAIKALLDGVITPEVSIFSSGKLVYPNPFNPSKPTIFKDWKAHGYTDMQTAIAVSSDVYFYQVGGGFGSQKGIGISGIDKVAKDFGIGEISGFNFSGEVSGVIPTPEWKEKYFKGDQWRIGDTYNSAIGQYGWQVTPLQMARGVAGIANGGTLPRPRITFNEAIKTEPVGENFTPYQYRIVRQGMRKTVTNGIATILNDLPVTMAVKTGTAQVGANNSHINSWLVGFFPSQNPKYSFAIMMESAPSSASQSASFAMRDMILALSTKHPEVIQYLNK